MKKLACGLGMATLLATTASFAKEPGTVVVSGNFTVGASQYEGNVTGSSKGGGGGGRVSVDVFLGNAFTVGVTSDVDYHKWKDVQGNGVSTETRSLFVVPSVQLGYWVPLGEHAAFWPVVRAGYGFAHDHTSDSLGGEQSPSGTVVSFAAEPQVLWLPTERFFLRFTPMSLSYHSTRWKDQGASMSYILGTSFTPSMGMGLVF